MTLWLILGAMAALAAGLLAWPLLARGRAAAKRADYDLAVYRDQLAEIERDAAAGAVTGEEAEAARAEIARRALAADAARESGESPSDTGRGAARIAAAIAVPALALAGALAIYLPRGAPHLTGPSAPAPEMRAEAPNAENAEMQALIQRLAGRLAENPEDLAGWRLLGRSLAQTERFADAAEAYRRALSIAPDDADLASLHAEALIFAQRGTVSVAAAAALQRALALDPKEPRARYYMGLAEVQAGRRREGLASWTALLGESPPDAPWVPLLRQRIARLADELGAPAPNLSPAPPQAAAPGASGPSAPRGPSREDMEAASQMSAEDRMAMIRSMVAGLAQRMADNPTDVDGWIRLGRSYRVLGDAAKSRAAYQKALALLGPNDPRRAQTEAALRALGKN